MDGDLEGEGCGSSEIRDLGEEPSTSTDDVATGTPGGVTGASSSFFNSMPAPMDRRPSCFFSSSNSDSTVLAAVGAAGATVGKAAEEACVVCEESSFTSIRALFGLNDRRVPLCSRDGLKPQMRPG